MLNYVKVTFAPNALAYFCLQTAKVARCQKKIFSTLSIFGQFPTVVNYNFKKKRSPRENIFVARLMIRTIKNNAEQEREKRSKSGSNDFEAAFAFDFDCRTHER